MIDHSQLIAKLYGYGVKGKELMWFESYLRGRKKQSVVACGGKSVWNSIGRGVPQGSILGLLRSTNTVPQPHLYQVPSANHQQS